MMTCNRSALPVGQNGWVTWVVSSERLLNDNRVRVGDASLPMGEELSKFCDLGNRLNFVDLLADGNFPVSVIQDFGHSD